MYYFNTVLYIIRAARNHVLFFWTHHNLYMSLLALTVTLRSCHDLFAETGEKERVTSPLHSSRRLKIHLIHLMDHLYLAVRKPFEWDEREPNS